MRPAPPRGTSSSSAPIVPHRRWRPDLEALEHLVKSWKSGMLADFLRVSTGSKAAMEKFVDALLEVDAA